MQRAYNTTFFLADGSAVAMQRRERPKLLADETGEWKFLYNGVISGDGKDVYSAVAMLG
jgi:hypothetical protein